MIRKCRDCVVGVLGACNDYCRPERKALMEQAHESANALGHTLTPFVQVGKRPIWKAHCVRCARSVTVQLDSRPDEPDIYGPAVTHPCAVREAP
jgi:hypothetical protein